MLSKTMLGLDNYIMYLNLKLNLINLISFELLIQSIVQKKYQSYSEKKSQLTIVFPTRQASTSHTYEVIDLSSNYAEISTLWRKSINERNG
jgi:hypothetical protein